MGFADKCVRRSEKKVIDAIASLVTKRGREERKKRMEIMEWGTPLDWDGVCGNKRNAMAVAFGA